MLDTLKAEHIKATFFLLGSRVELSPEIKIARLAVSSRFQGNKVGSALLGHAVRSALKVREDIGVRALIVDAKTPEVASFYTKFGFKKTQNSPLYLYLFV